MNAFSSVLFKKVFLRLIAFLLLCGNFNNAEAQNQISNEGREFWLAFGANNSTSTSSLRLYITSKFNTQVRIRTATTNNTYNIVADSTTEVILSAATFSVSRGTNSSNATTNKAIEITSDRDIAVFASNVQSNTTDATVVLPKASVGVAPEYIINRVIGSSDANNLLFVANDDSTEIIFQNQPNGYNDTVRLNKFQVYVIPYLNNSNNTIYARSGKGCKTFSVFFFNNCINLGRGTNGAFCAACDHIYTQVLPISKWGKNYIMTPLLNQTNGSDFSIMAQLDSTYVQISGRNPMYLNRGQRYADSTNSQRVVCINADKPISVFQGLKGTSCHSTNLGDPAVIDLNANEQTINKATFSALTGGVITNHYINILIDSMHKSRLYIDSVPAKTNKWLNTGCGRYVIYRDSIASGSHTIINDSGFIAYAYGLTRAESYLFSIGSSYENQFYNFNIVAPKRCPGDTVKVQRIGDPLRSVWFLYGNRVDSGSTASYVFSTPGTYQIKMVAQPFGIECPDTITKTVQIGGPPIVFPNDTTYCSDFKIVARLDTALIDSFSWSVANHKADTLLINKSGKYAVFMRDTFSCSYVDSFNVVQLKTPTLNLLYDSIRCKNDTLVFLNRSQDTGLTATLQYRLRVDSTFYSFSDSILKIPYSDTGTKVGFFHVRKGATCVDSSRVDFSIKPIPIARFVADTLQACLPVSSWRFRNTSDSFSYPLQSRWIFNQTDTSTAFSPNRSFTSSLNVVRLTVRNSFGCESSSEDTIKPFPPISAQFSVSDTLRCLQNNSFDFTGAPRIQGDAQVRSFGWRINGALVDTSQHLTNYSFTSSGQYTVSHIVESNFGCRDTAVKTVVVSPNPITIITADTFHSCLKGNALVFRDTSAYYGTLSSRLWNVNGLSDTAKTFRPVFQSWGTFTLSLIVKNTLGCSDTNIRTVNIFPQSNLAYSSNTACSRDTLSVWSRATVDTGSITSHAWLVNSNLQFSGSAFKFRLDSAVRPDLRLITETNFGCRDTANYAKALWFRPLPTVLYSTNSPVCVGDSLEIRNLTADTGVHAGMQYRLQWYSTEQTENRLVFKRMPQDTGVQQQLFYGVDGFGCRDSVQLSYRVMPNPIVRHTSDTFSTCLKGNALSVRDTSFSYDDIGKIYWRLGTQIDTGKVYRPRFTQAGTYKFTQRVELNLGCTDSIEGTIVIFPQSNLAYSSDTACSRDTLSVWSRAAVDTGSITSHAWLVNSNLQFSGSAFKFRLDSAARPDLRLITETNFGCRDTANYANALWFRPLPTVLYSTNSPVCVGDSLEIRNLTADTGVHAGMQYRLQWYSTEQTENRLVFKRMPQDTGVQQQLFYGVDGFGCRDSVQLEYQVIPNPKADFFFPYRLQCLKGNIFEPENRTQTFGYPTEYFWDFSIATFDIFEPVISYPAVGVYPMYMTATNSFGCSNIFRDTLTIDFFPIPQIGFELDLDSQCLFGNEFVFVNTSQISAGSFTTRVGFEGVDTVLFGDTLKYSLSQPGLYALRVFINSDMQCKDTIDGGFIRVWEMPVAEGSVSRSTGCEGQTFFTFTDATQMMPTNLRMRWYYDGLVNTDSTDSFRYVFNNEGVYEVLLEAESEQLCRDTMRLQVIVNPVPIPAISVLEDNQCFLNQDFELYGSVSLTKDSFRLVWDVDLLGEFLDLDTLRGIVFPNIGTMNVQLTAISDSLCESSITTLLQIHPNPEAKFLLDTNFVCLSSPDIRAQDVSDIVMNYSIESAWYINAFDPIGNSDSLQYTFSDSGNYTLILESISNMGCRDTVSKELRVSKNPIVSFSLNKIDSCLFTNRLELTTFIQSMEGSGSTQWTIDMGDGTYFDNLSQIQHSYAFADTFALDLRVIDSVGCTADFQDVHIVRPQVEAVIGFDNFSPCLRTSWVELIDVSDAVGLSYNRVWSIAEQGFTSFDSSFSFVFTDSGFKTIRLEVESPWFCRSSDSLVLEVLPKNNLAVLWSDSIYCFNEQDFKFTYNGEVPFADLEKVWWQFADGMSDSIFEVNRIFSDTGVFTHFLYSMNKQGCLDTLAFTVKVEPNPIAEIALNDTSWCVNNQAIHFASLGRDLRGLPLSYDWDFGDASTSTDSFITDKQYASSGKYLVRHIVQSLNSCTDTTYIDVSLFANPVATAVSDKEEACLKGNAFALTAVTVFAQNPGQHYWTIPNAGLQDSGNVITFKAPAPGQYPYQLISNDLLGCADTTRGVLWVHPQANIDFIADTVCLGESNRFISLSTIDSGSLLSYDWSFGDGLGGVGADRLHTYAKAGNYDVRLITTSNFGCKDTLQINQAAMVRTLPVPYFDFDKSYDSLRITGYNFNDRSQGFGPFVYQWQFDRFGNSFAANPYAEFSDTGRMKVELRVTDVFGCSKDTSRSFIVYPYNKLWVPNAFSPNGNGLNDRFGVEGLVYAQRYHLQIFNRWGELLFETRNPFETWDGSFNGQIVQEGVYLYKVRLVNLQNELISLDGTVTLLR